MTENTIDIRPGNIVRTGGAARRRLEVFLDGEFRGHFIFEGGDGYLLHKADGSYAACPLPYEEWRQRRSHETLMRAGAQTYAAKTRGDLLRVACVAHADGALPSLAAIHRGAAQAQQAALEEALTRTTAQIIGKHAEDMASILRMLANHGKVFASRETATRDLARVINAELDAAREIAIHQHNEIYAPKAEA